MKFTILYDQNSNLNNLDTEIKRILAKVFPALVSREINYSAYYTKGSGYVTINSFSFDEPKELYNYDDFTVMFKHPEAGSSSTVYYRLQGSNDGTTWENVDSKSGTRGKYATVYLLNNADISFADITAYKHYRVQVNSDDNQQVAQVVGIMNFL